MNTNAFPNQHVIFWPVGTGDSTTIVIDNEHVIQVDLHVTADSSDVNTPRTPIVEVLVDRLPKRNGRPYLSVFALTHADLDHCQGFGELLASDIFIGELWATPRLWREYADGDAEMCEDAQMFHAEAERRVRATLRHLGAGRPVPSGDRVRVIGYDTDLDDENHPYRDLPRALLSFPGEIVTMIDGVDLRHAFEAFIHAPFKDDCAAARNDTSLAMQVTLKNRGADGRILLLGDVAYSTLRRIFDISTALHNQERVQWDVLLAPHHCSRKVMYAPDANGKEEFKRDIMVDLDNSRRERGYVVASCQPIPAMNKPGDNPPHALAKARYQELGIEHFICTQEHGGVDNPQPVVFSLTAGGGFELQEVTPQRNSLGKAIGTGVAIAAGIGTLVATRQAIKQARGAEAAPTKPVGFGKA